MKNLMQIKRDSLETFIMEQMIGPNGCNGKFSFADTSFNGDIEEIINTTPGSIYSTAVLFPKKAVDESILSIIDDTDISNSTEDDIEEEITRTDSNEQYGAIGSAENDEDIYSLNRRFPTTIGLSCCLKENVNLNEDLKITVSGRYYTKIVSDDRQKVQVLIKEHEEEFKYFWDTYPQLHLSFTYSNNSLSIKPISQKEFGDIKTLLKDINKQIAEDIATKNNILDLQKDVKEEYRFLLSYREAIFSRELNRLKEKGTQYLTTEQKEKYIRILHEIEMYETFMSYFDDLIDLYDHKGYGYWRSHTFQNTVDISQIPFTQSTAKKQIYKPELYPVLANIVHIPCATVKGEKEPKVLSLSLWLQITRNSKKKQDKNKYVKVLLENTSTPFTETKKNYFSIVNEGVNELCFFGVKIEIESTAIVPYQEKDSYIETSKDEDKLNFLYRDIKDFAVGHLCSANWDLKEDNTVQKIYSEFIPSYETPDIEPVPRNKYSDYIIENGSLVPEPYLNQAECLQFKWLSTFSNADDTIIIKQLKEFVEIYGCWIKDLQNHVDKKDLRFAQVNINACLKDYERMLANINGILADNPQNMKTFRMMNSAMFMQLWHNNRNQQYTREKGISDIDVQFYQNANDELFQLGQHAAWRPFQLAFILLNLDGIIQHPNDLKWEYRNECVDLVWFPTGGGKTEAYLGLIALCIIDRRTRYPQNGGGVAVIMRYTLRLLTTQQFQRALKLILALEQLRKWGKEDDKYYLGEEEISIGLYVGANSLPNKHKELETEALHWHNREGGKNSTRIPLDKCPWCGSRLDYDQGEFVCTNNDCTFCDSLPVRLCDEDIYQTPPTLLFGTVDKFASIAHKVATEKSKRNSDSRRLFGKRKDISYLPPDLIIQDELHLLLGPLGSAVSLFECAIDQLCSRKTNNDFVIRPKIISSTATTRNTELQIRALYDRNVNIFPKNGITHDDSFFAFYKRKSENGKIKYVSKRKYIGILPTGRTQMTTQMRLAAILLVHRAWFEKQYGTNASYEKRDFEKVADYYYSVISYFNSLKEVGKTDALFYTEYTKYVKRLFKRVMRFGDLLECFYAMDNLHESELSGRLTGSEVNERFAEVGQEWKSEHRLPYQDADGKWHREITPPDYILATNMISVGLDISRFNTIIMNSMPRNIAEYIQASSRVARNDIGLVLTLHNPFRSRDVSHFERFREFHEKLYFYVEPISITPFSQKSIEKYLPLYMAALIRHSFAELADSKSAANITNQLLKQKVRDKLLSYFQERYQRTANLTDTLQRSLLTNELEKYIEQYVDNALKQWIDLAKDGNLVYTGREQSLFTAVEDYDDTKNSSFWTVPMSLRIIEPEAVLHVHVKN